MVSSPVVRIAAILAACALTAAAQAQTRSSGSTQRSNTMGGGGNTIQSQLSGSTVGSGIVDTASGFSSAGQPLRQADDLRAASGRGAFMGEDEAAGQFMGGDQQATGQRSMRQGQLQGRNSRGTRGARGMNQRGAMRPGQGGAPAVRPTLSVGFAYVPTVSPQIGQTARSFLQRIPGFNGNSSIRASIKESVVVLEGTVATKHESMLAAQMVAMEPGVLRVDNRLTVAPPTPPTPGPGR